MSAHQGLSNKSDGLTKAAIICSWLKHKVDKDKVPVFKWADNIPGSAEKSLEYNLCLGAYVFFFNTFYIDFAHQKYVQEKNMGEKLLTIFQANKKQKQTKFCKFGNIRKSKLLPRVRNFFIHSC